jgi:predicted ATP-grasp superfamily ATP-dependent carboligase
MPSLLRANLQHDAATPESAAPTVMIAAISGRALAACARRAGYVPLVADLFADLDTRVMSDAWVRAPGSLARGLSRSALPTALDQLAAGRAPEGLVWGNGFEDRPTLLEMLGRRYTLLGNSSDVVLSIKDPLWFADLCGRAGVPHPHVLRGPPPRDMDQGGTWLEKRTGGVGGGHVTVARSRRIRSKRYLQQCVVGRPVSALFLADGQRGKVLGFSEQWKDPTPLRPFRYGGAVRPAAVAPALCAAMADAVTRLVPHTGLVGLNSADFMVRVDGFDLLEINPRPGATLDVYTDRDGELFRMHVEACRGHLPAAPPVFLGAAAAATVYAGRNARLPAAFAWPDWAADRQPSESAVTAGAPLCTVLAAADDAETARNLVVARRHAILMQTGGNA